MPVIGPQNPGNEPNSAPSSASILPGGSVPSKTDGMNDGMTGGQTDLTALSEEGHTAAAPKRKRSHSRKSVLNASSHKEEYLRLMQQGWSSGALERYAAYRFGETITASAFRTHKARIKAQRPDWLEPEHLTGKSAKQIVEPEHRVDVMKVRHQLAVLQMQRISVDVKTEMDLGKLFSSTKGEIDLLNVLLDRIKADEEDYGIRQPVATQAEVHVSDLPATVAPRHQTLAEALGAGGLDQAQLINVARELGKIVPITRTREAG